MRQSRPNQEPAWSHPLTVGDLPEEGAALKLVPNEQERAALARHVGVLAVPALSADLRVRPDGKGGVAIEGDLSATVRQTCVVSLEPFDNAVSEHIDLRFLADGTASALAEDADREGDPADTIRGGVIDLGALVTEFLALGVDPYPRRPGVAFAPPEPTEEGASAFAALAKLKAKGRQGD
jgi:uncharacterized metal-binding protein YceD (DUF177 family)